MPDLSEQGALLASGRAADVFAFGDGLVLRRYRTPHDCLYEAAVMQHVADHGYPAPRVVEVSGGDIVMERIEGHTMLADFGKHPWLIRRHARTLAELVTKLHAIPPPAWLHDKLGGGDAIVHLDLHPDNVILSPRGPVVIDWTNAGCGDPNAEVADLWVLFSAAQPPGNRFERRLISAGRGLFMNSFLRHFDRDALRKHVRAAADHRIRDRNMTDVERERMERFAQDEGEP
jgi:aminoglycoside phosphotransferase (APT) family kinase protein